VPERQKVEHDELQAAIEARKELGPRYDDEVIDSFVRRIEKKVDPRRQLPASKQGREGSFLLALVSLGFGVPLTAIASSNSGLAAVIVVWLGIVLVNAVYNRG